MTAPLYARDPAPLDLLRADPGRPILLAHGQVLTRDATLGDWADADVLVGGTVIVGVGPGLVSAAEDDGMVVIDCRGCVVMPSGTDSRPRLTPGEPATIAVYRLSDPDCASLKPAVDRPGHLDLLLIDGTLAMWGGVAIPGMTMPEQGVSLRLVEVANDAPQLGLWSDERGFLRQRLLPNGRYVEARGEREDAYRGRFWIDGDRIDYLDDEGFWAFGIFVNDQLHHAGYILEKTL